MRWGGAALAGALCLAPLGRAGAAPGAPEVAPVEGADAAPSDGAGTGPATLGDALRAIGAFDGAGADQERAIESGAERAVGNPAENPAERAPTEDAARAPAGVDRTGEGADRPSDPLAPRPADGPPADRPPAAAVDPRLVPPPPSETVWPRIVIVSGVALVVAGIAGMVASPGCATRDAADRCLDARGSAPLWPALVVVGLGATVTGNYWDRWTRLDSVPPAQPVTP